MERLTEPLTVTVVRGSPDVSETAGLLAVLALALGLAREDARGCAEGPAEESARPSWSLSCPTWQPGRRLLPGDHAGGWGQW